MKTQAPSMRGLLASEYLLSLARADQPIPGQPLPEIALAGRANEMFVLVEKSDVIVDKHRFRARILQCDSGKDRFLPKEIAGIPTAGGLHHVAKLLLEGVFCVSRFLFVEEMDFAFDRCCLG